MKKLILIALILAPMTVFAQKFGHVDSYAILSAMPEVKTVQTEIEALGTKYQQELKTMQDEIERKAQALQSQRDSLPENILQRRSQEIQDLYDRYQTTRDSFQQELQKTEAEKMQPIQQKVLNAIKEIGEAGGYVYIMDMSAGIPYVSTTLSTDISAELKAKLGIK